jgi:hypothetical protein
VASRISTLELFNKVKRHVVASPAKDILDFLIKDAIVQADRELRQADSLRPLAWDIAYHDEVRTRPHAFISAVSQASPGVVTADSIDSTISGHGLVDDDVVYIDGIGGMIELNTRLYVVEYIDADTFSLKSLDGLSAIDTSSYTAYTSGGAAYHVGAVLDDTTILADVDSEWTIKRILDCPTFAGYPSDAISMQEMGRQGVWSAATTGRPRKYRYWQNMTTATTIAHYLLWWPAANDTYQVSIPYQKEVPDISAWTATTYPFHPAQVHDALWHGGLAHLAYAHAKATKNRQEGGDLNYEIMNAQYWMNEWAKDKVKVVNFSLELQGLRGGSGGFSA